MCLIIYLVDSQSYRHLRKKRLMCIKGEKESKARIEAAEAAILAGGNKN